jgi:hypothetical protein
MSASDHHPCCGVAGSIRVLGHLFEQPCLGNFCVAASKYQKSQMQTIWDNILYSIVY